MDYQDDLQRSEAMISHILTFLVKRGIQDGFISFDDLEAHPSLRKFFHPCMSWLIREDLISFGQVMRTLDGSSAFDQPALTSKGFSVLGETVVVGGEQQLIGKAIQEVSSGQKSYAGLGDFVGGLLGGFTKSLGS